jgi:hypothetical protein
LQPLDKRIRPLESLVVAAVFVGFSEGQDADTGLVVLVKRVLGINTAVRLNESLQVFQAFGYCRVSGGPAVAENAGDNQAGNARPIRGSVRAVGSLPFDGQKLDGLGRKLGRSLLLRL